MKSRSRLVARAEGGRTRLDCIRSSPPILLRQTAEAVYLVGGAAGPLGGDDLLLEVEVGAGASLGVRSAAASVVLPGDGRTSRTVVQATVAAGGALRWEPEPVIASVGCRHGIVNRLALDRTASVVWRDELVLGRSGEDTGSASTRIEVTLDGKPLLRNELLVGPWAPGWDGPAVAGCAGAVGSALVVGPIYRHLPPEPVLLGPGAAVLPLAGSGCLITATAADALELRRLLERGTEMLGAG